MIQPRLASSVVVSSLLRLADSQGGFGAVIAKGDATSGAIAVILMERGRRIRFLERALQPEGIYSWQDVSTVDLDDQEAFSKTLARRRSFDPDLWIIELDIASAERFAAEMNSVD